jgi:hypothetical protein
MVGAEALPSDPRCRYQRIEWAWTADGSFTTTDDWESPIA